VAQDLRITCLEIGSVTASLRERSQSKLEQRLAEAENISDVYDEQHNYREDVVMAVLYEAAQDALAEDAKTVTYELTVNLVHDEGHWWIIPDDELLKAISGGILK
jgi:predicted Zn-dependent protease with MMP-like domain